MSDEKQIQLTPNQRRAQALAVHGKSTQFGGVRANVHSSKTEVKPWSVHNSIKRFARMQIDMNDKNAVAKILGKNPTIAEVIAMNTLMKATKANMRAVEYVTDRVDGKVASINIATDFDAIRGMSEEEIDECLDEINNIIELERCDSETDSAVITYREAPKA